MRGKLVSGKNNQGGGMSKAGKGLVYKTVSMQPESYTRFKNKCAKHGIPLRTVFQILMDAWSDNLLDYGSQGLMSKGVVLREVAIVSASNIDLSAEPVKTDAHWEEIEKKIGTLDDIYSKGDDEPEEAEEPSIKEATPVPDYVGKMPGKTVSLEEVKRKLAKEAA